MNKHLGSFLIMALMAVTGAASAADYNKPPADDKLYPACVKETNANYTGGNDKSPVRGQTKAQAYCMCLWNETPDDFKGSLADFAETPKGKSMKSACEKHSDWKS
ncbi:MAG: hypothetical protein EON49_11605 [Acidovorax sp.]|nr:MAG: hypothetical protein EON49_11605 [Acidovorax sp.]